MTYEDKQEYSIIERLALFGAVLAFFVLLFRAVSIYGPIYGSDEYAYIASGKYYQNIEQIYHLDNFMQKLNNFLYFILVNTVFRAKFPDIIVCMRFLNVAFYISSSIIIYTVTRSAFGRLQGAIVFLLTAILPFSAYTMAVMPEIPFLFLFCLVAAVLVLATPRHPLVSAASSGLVVALMLLVKPNAVANVVGTAVTFLVLPFLLPKKARWQLRMVIWPAIFLAAVYLGLLLLSKPLAGHWRLNPFYFVGDIYVGIVAHAGVVDKIWGTIPYLLGNGLALLFFFSLPVWAALRWLVDSYRRCSSLTRADQRIAVLALLLVFTTGAAITMASYLTVLVSQGMDSEGHRLHGRYYGYLFPFLAALSGLLLVGDSGRAGDTRPVSLIWKRFPFLLSLVVVAICALRLDHWFRIFPWDFPELFVLYHRDNSYWRWSGEWVGGRMFVFTILFAVAAVGLWRPRIGAHLYPVGLAMVFLVGNIQTSLWQADNASRLSIYHEEAKGFSSFLSTDSGPGLVIGPERYGTMSYVMSHLPGMFHVAVKELSSVITGTDIPPDVKWIVTCGTYSADFPYRNVIHGRVLSLYQLGLSGLPVELGSRQDWMGEPIDLSFAQGRDTGILFGFGPPEPWGTWTTLDHASVLLPQRVSGPVELVLNAWTTTGHPSGKLTVSLGDAETEVAIGTEPKSIVVRLMPTHPVDRVDLVMPVRSLTPGGRFIGLALIGMTIRRP